MINAMVHGKPTIGLMGLPGSGKSTVAGILAASGCGVIDADALARAALDESAVREQLVAWWGPGVLDGQGRVDRRALGRIVFEEAAERERLESLVHPRVAAGRAAQRERLAGDPEIRAIVEDCPLLLEVGLDRECDALVLVDAPREVRLERVRGTRGWDEAELARREKNQWPLDIKRDRAQYVIVNDADPAATRRQVHTTLLEILADSQPTAP